MSTLTIILLIYVIIDIILDTIGFICLRRIGFTLKDISQRVRYLLHPKPLKNDDDVFTDEDMEWDDFAEYNDEEDTYENVEWSENEM